jgi:hypothetical protein
MPILLVCRTPHSYLTHHNRAIVSLVDRQRRKRVSRRVSFEDEPGEGENEVESTPRPKRTASKVQVASNGISDLASTDDPDWEISRDSDEGDLSL